ncbi:MAG: hemolysin family protein [Bacteroidetes bacterium]|jgi:putative hemolysin|nr:hemolysin family protein [Bacteroidota bacterium]MCB0605000.1 HlyC/CorC family transporter [Saprospiraceae bacterium]MCO5277732.1 hemolysin family protein [Saprospiraceae bacterium]HMT76166.1 hemolysin family protein [Saprospiraceae bacterium]
MEVSIILGLMLLNGIFAMCEMALVSSKKARLAEKASKGNKNAVLVLQLIDNPDKFLSAIQVGITLIGILAGVYGGQAFASDLEKYLINFSWLAPYAHSVSLGIIISVITYFSIVIGELIPKKIGLLFAEDIAVAVAPFIKYFTKITSPIIWFLGISTKLLSKILFLKDNDGDIVSEDEIKMMVKMANEDGTIDNKESELIHNIFRFADRKAYSIMTPRNEVVWLDISESSEEIHSDIMESGLTKFPVCDDSLDNILGVVNLKDYLMQRNKPGYDIQNLLHPAVLIPETLTSLKILEQFRKERRYFGVVINEHGSVEGIITLHDLTENIFGSLPDLEEEEEIMIFKREDGSFLIDGSYRIDELRDQIYIDEFFHEDIDYTTIAGYVIEKLGKMPEVGDKFTEGIYTFEILDLDKSKIDKVLVTEADPS